MPQLDLKQALSEVKAGKARPLYWIYGSECQEAKHLIESLREGIQRLFPAWARDFCEESFEGSSLGTQQLMESLESISPLGGPRFVVVHDAHEVAWASVQAQWTPFFEGKAPVPLQELGSICVLIARELDQRTKWAQHLSKHATVIECAEPRPLERGAAIQSQAQRLGLEVPPELLDFLRMSEPWNSEWIERELEIWELSGRDLGRYFESKGIAGFQKGGVPSLIESFFRRDLKSSLRALMPAIQDVSENFMLLGLMAWWVRQLSKGSGGIGGTGFRQRQLQEWLGHWKDEELHALNQELLKMDLRFKSSGDPPLGSWQTLLFRFCR